MQRHFAQFVDRNNDSSTAEYILSDALDDLLQEQQTSCYVLQSHDLWM
ncbi:MAG: hypothetical protein H6765_05315 [Candidatus Peribacteria bacterium]|nr:MAG: hypothetical protein H6765_05315 [Candidatus Peribacteria bacterium]